MEGQRRHPRFTILEARARRRHLRTQAGLWVVFDAIHGEQIDGAIDTFYAEAERGARVAWTSGEQSRAFPVDVIGYAGHNRMMDGKKPPEPTTDGQPIPSFVMACYSKS